MFLRFVLFFSGVAGVEFKAVDFRRRARIFGFGITKAWIGWRRRPFFSTAKAGAAWGFCFFARLWGGVSLGILCETAAAGAAARFLGFFVAVFAGAGGGAATACFLKLALTAGVAGRTVRLAGAAFFTGVAFFTLTGAPLRGAGFFALAGGSGASFTLPGACALRAALFLPACCGGTGRGSGFVAGLPFRAARGALTATSRWVSFVRGLPLVTRAVRGGAIRAVALLSPPRAAPGGRGWVSGFSLRFDFFSLGFPCSAGFLRIYQITGQPQRPRGAPSVAPVHSVLKKNPMGLFCAGDFATPKINRFPLLHAQPLNLSPLPAKADPRGSLAVLGVIFSIQA